MYRRSTFRDELLIDGCREIVALEERINDLDAMLSSVATARRAPTTCDCGAPVPWGSHFCANCGRPVGDQPVISCDNCGHPLPADATFCAGCGRAADPAARKEQAPPGESPVAAVAPAEEPQSGAEAWER
jgi:predicted amidophosphoribosyltransferase